MCVCVCDGVCEGDGVGVRVCVTVGDDVCGVSVRIRGHDNNVIQIWNQDSELVRGANVIQRLKELLPNIEIFPSYQCKLHQPIYNHYIIMT